ncbi:hypothetical protein D3C85_1498550 [compost metagenome]
MNLMLVQWVAPLVVFAVFVFDQMTVLLVWILSITINSASLLLARTDTARQLRSQTSQVTSVVELVSRLLLLQPRLVRLSLFAHLTRMRVRFFSSLTRDRRFESV